MKTENKKLKTLGTNSYVVWVSNYYRERGNGKEIRTVLIGDTFHVYSVEFANGEFKTELLHFFNKEFGKNPKLAENADYLLNYKKIERPYVNKDISISIENFLHENEELVDAVSFQIHEESERFYDSPIWD